MRQLEKIPTERRSDSRRRGSLAAAGAVAAVALLLQPPYLNEFPGWWAAAYPATIASAGLPVHERIAAPPMHLFGTAASCVFRCWMPIASVA